MGKYYLMTEEQEKIVDHVKRFCEKELLPVIPEYDRRGEFPMEVYQKAGEAGLWGIGGIPEKYGGIAMSTVTYALVREAMGYYDIGYAGSHDAAAAGFWYVNAAGTEKQKQELADRILKKGQFSCLCISEAHCGSDVGGIKTTAVCDGDGYLLNGSKAFVTNGGIGDIYVVLAVTDKSSGYKGMSLFWVERGMEGVSVGNAEDKMGFRLSDTREVSFTNVRVPCENLIGEEGSGFRYIMRTLNYSRPLAGGIFSRSCPAGAGLCLGIFKGAQDDGRSAL